MIPALKLSVKPITFMHTKAQQLQRLNELLGASQGCKLELEPGEAWWVAQALRQRLAQEVGQAPFLPGEVDPLDFWHPGWAVVYRSSKPPRDSLDLWVMRVADMPGHMGTVECLKDGKVFSQVRGPVQASRQQARKLKLQLVQRMRLRRVTSADLWDPGGDCYGGW